MDTLNTLHLAKAGSDLVDLEKVVVLLLFGWAHSYFAIFLTCC